MKFDDDIDFHTSVIFILSDIISKMFLEIVTRERYGGEIKNKKD